MLSKWKDIFDILQKIFTILAIVGAGIWFYMQGESRPRAIISHEITHRKIHAKKTWVHVSVILENIGKLPINIESGKVWIQQIKPIPKSLIKDIKSDVNIVNEDTFIVNWPNPCGYIHKLKDKIWIEPGEKDRKSYEFLISSDLKTIKVYSHFENPQKSWKFWEKLSPIGWENVTIYDLK